MCADIPQEIKRDAHASHKCSNHSNTSKNPSNVYFPNDLLRCQFRCLESSLKTAVASFIFSHRIIIPAFAEQISNCHERWWTVTEALKYRSQITPAILKYPVGVLWMLEEWHSSDSPHADPQASGQGSFWFILPWHWRQAVNSVPWSQKSRDALSLYSCLLKTINCALVPFGGQSLFKGL